MDLIRFVAMDIITYSAYHAPSWKKSTIFRRPFTDKRSCLQLAIRIDGACIQNEYAMAKTVRCDICGGLYNQRHLSSHKRLSHGKREKPAGFSKQEPPSIAMIVSLYKQLPEKQKKEVLDRLASGDQTEL